MNNGSITPELATKIFNTLAQIDDGNETIMTDSFGRFIQLFPEHKMIAEKVFMRENARPYRDYKGD